MLPDALIIGAQKAGTTTLHELLVQHPSVLGPTWRLPKEVHHLDQHPDGNLVHYRAHFPTATEVAGARAETGAARVIESTPSYLFHPAVPAAAARALRGVRCIVLLREPIERAWSQHQHARRLGLEDLDLHDALDREAQRIAPGAAIAARGGGVPVGDPCYWASYVARSRYVPQLERWRHAVGDDRLLVLRSEDLWRSTVEALAAVHDFLDLEPITPAAAGRWNAHEAAPLGDADRAALHDRLGSVADEIRAHLGWGWDS